MFTLILGGIFNTLGNAGSGIAAILVLVLAIYSLYVLWTSTTSGTGRLLWTVAILFLPFFGSILYLLLGRK